MGFEIHAIYLEYSYKSIIYIYIILFHKNIIYIILYIIHIILYKNNISAQKYISIKITRKFVIKE